MKFSIVVEVLQSSGPLVFAYLQEGGLNSKKKRDHSIVILSRMSRRDCMHHHPRYILEAFTLLIASWPDLVREKLFLPLGCLVSSSVSSAFAVAVVTINRDFSHIIQASSVVSQTHIILETST